MIDTHMLIQNLANLFAEAGQAHHQAYIESDGADPDWAIWYADYLIEKLPQHLNGARLTRSEIIYLLMRLSYEQAMNAPQASWSLYYARHFIQHYT